MKGIWIAKGTRRFINCNRHREQEQKEALGYGGRTIENLMCSKCRKITMVDDSIAYRYCPHCGAEMEKEVVEG